MKRILTFLLIAVVGIMTVNAQTDESKRRPKKQNTTQQAAPAKPKKEKQKPAKPKKEKQPTRPNILEKPETIQISSNRQEGNTQPTAQPATQPAIQPTPPPTLPTATPEVKTFTANGVSFQMVEVRGGSFRMGATSEQGSDADDDEKPVHSVTLSSYYIGKYEVTQELWQAVMGSNPSNFKGAKKPVEKVSWNDCKTFISKLNSLTGKNFRLPTEAEWEYAARGGSKSRGYKYSGSNDLNSVAWYGDNSGGTTHDVGTKQPNELGIYDMSGNVWEWCNDWFGSYSSNSQANPTGPSSGSYRVCRGGGWGNSAGNCRSSVRDGSTPVNSHDNLGLRLALSE